MITKRDQDILNFVTDFHIATTNQIHKLLFANLSLRCCRNRLHYLNKAGYLNIARSTIDNCNAYYTDKKPVQIHHDLIRSELFVNLKNRYTILEWNNESPIVNIRPDATAYFKNSSFTYINSKGVIFPVFIEIHINNKFNFEKYKQLLSKINLREMFGIMPRVIICTDRQVQVPNIGIKFKVINVKMDGLDSIFL